MMCVGKMAPAGTGGNYRGNTTAVGPAASGADYVATQDSGKQVTLSFCRLSLWLSFLTLPPLLLAPPCLLPPSSPPPPRRPPRRCRRLLVLLDNTALVPVWLVRNQVRSPCVVATSSPLTRTAVVLCCLFYRKRNPFCSRSRITTTCFRRCLKHQ